MSLNVLPYTYFFNIIIIIIIIIILLLHYALRTSKNLSAYLSTAVRLFAG